MIDAAAKQAQRPTEKQAEAGNYKKGHVKVRSLDITIENAKGTKRRPEWPPLAAHYGYIKRTTGADGDHVDVFIGPNADSRLVVVIDQTDQRGRFDEHKCMVGFNSVSDALRAYRQSYTKGWKVGDHTPMSTGEFRYFLKHGDMNKPARKQVKRLTDKRLTDHLVSLQKRKGATMDKYAANITSSSWDEGKHPRANDGKFGSGGGSSAVKGHNGEEMQPAPGGERNTQGFVNQTLERIKQRAAQKRRQDANPQPQPPRHELDHRNLPAAVQQALLNWSAQANDTFKGVMQSGGAAKLAGMDVASAKRKAFDEVGRDAIARHSNDLKGLIQTAMQHHGIDIKPFIRHNNFVPREMAARLKPNPSLFNPVTEQERYQIERYIDQAIEYYAGRGPKNSPGQMDLFGGETRRSSKTQQSFGSMTWDATKHPRSKDGKFSSGPNQAGGPKTPKAPKAPAAKPASNPSTGGATARQESQLQVSSVLANQLAKQPHVTNADQARQQALNHWSAYLSEKEKKHFDSDQHYADEVAKRFGDHGRQGEGKPAAKKGWDSVPEEGKRPFEQNAIAPLAEHAGKLEGLANNPALGARYAWEVATKQGKPGSPMPGDEFVNRWKDVAKQQGFDPDHLLETHPEFNKHRDTIEKWRKWGTDASGDSNTGDKKERWQKTRDEFVDGATGDARAIRLAAHPKHVREAVQRGEDVPTEVLKEYANNNWAKRALSAREDGPKEGERNADGLVFRKGRWHREDQDSATPSPGSKGDSQGGIQFPTLKNDDAKAGDQLGLIDGMGQRAQRPAFKAKELGGEKQNALFNKSGLPGQMDFFGGDGTPDDMVYKPSAAANDGKPKAKVSDRAPKQSAAAPEAKPAPKPAAAKKPYTPPKDAREANQQIAEFNKGNVKPGDVVKLVGSNNTVEIKRVNKQSVTTDAGSRWKFDDIVIPGATSKDIRAYLENGTPFEPKQSQPEANQPSQSKPEAPKQRTVGYGDIVKTKDGRLGRLRGSSGMGSDRVKVVDQAGNFTYENGSELTKATDAEIGDKVFPQQANANSPKDGDRNAEGLVFHNGRWHREDQVPKSTKTGRKPAKQTAPRAKKTAETPTLSRFADTLNKLDKGEMTAEELKAAHAEFVENRDTIAEELAKMKKDDIDKWHHAPNIVSFGGFDRGLKKAAVIKNKLDDIEQSFAIGDGGIAFNPFDKDARGNAIKKKVEGVTDEMIKAHAEKTQARYKAAEDRFEKLKESTINPQTADDWRRKARVSGGYDKLSPKQQADFDDAIASDRRKRMPGKPQAPTEIRGLEGGADTAGETSIVKGHHQKRDADTFTVRTEKMFGKEKFKEMANAARKLGGNYVNARIAKAYNATPGFQFFDEESAKKFQKLLGGESLDISDEVKQRQAEKQRRQTETLTERADAIEERNEAKLNAPRKDNTARRARMARGVESDARNAIAQAKTMRAIAKKIESGEVKHLAGVRAATHVDQLDTLLSYAKHNAIRAEQKADPNMRYQDRENRWNSPAKAEDIAHAEYPWPRLHANEMLKASSVLKQIPGLKQFGAKVGKWYRETPGDGVKQLTTQKEIDALTSALPRMRRHPDHEVRRLAENMSNRIESFSRLQNMDIKNTPELRAALREYHSIKKNPEGPDPIAEKLRDLKRDKTKGFFPTPPDLVNRMLDHAAIEDGHEVLEPSAGVGNIMDAVKDQHPGAKTHGIEQKFDFADVLKMKGHQHEVGDFLDHKKTYDRIVMNPPFENRQDEKHVKHAYSLLKPGGRMVAIMGAGAWNNERSSGFRDWASEVGAKNYQLPEGSFAGDDALKQTNVNTHMVIIDKPMTDKEKYQAIGWNTGPMPSVAIDYYEAITPAGKAAKGGRKIVRGDEGDTGYFVTIDDHPVFVEVAGATPGTIVRGPKSAKGKHVKSVKGKRSHRSPGSRKGVKDMPGQLHTDGDFARRPEAQQQLDGTYWNPADARKNRVDAATKFDKAIVEEIGDKRDDVELFKELAADAHKMLTTEASESNESLRELLSHFGYKGKKTGQIITAARRAGDGNSISRFDEMVDMARNNYPQLLRHSTGSMAGAGDDEQALLNRLQDGFTKPPSKTSPEVFDLAHQMFKSAGKPEDFDDEFDPEWDLSPESRAMPLEAVPFSASPWSDIERYGQPGTRRLLRAPIRRSTFAAST